MRYIKSFMEIGNRTILMWKAYKMHPYDEDFDTQMTEISMDSDSDNGFAENIDKQVDEMINLIAPECCAYFYESFMSRMLKQLQDSHDNSRRDFSQDIIDRLNAEQSEYVNSRTDN